MENALLESAESWLSHKTFNEAKSPRTVSKYRGHLETLSAFLAEGGNSLFEASSDQLIEFTGIYLHKKGLKPASRRVAIAAIRGFYKWAFERGEVVADPAIALAYPQTGRKLPVAMGLGHAEKLLMQPDISTLPGVRDAAIIALMVGCGFRVGGICGLNEKSLVWYQHQGISRLAVKTLEKGDRERLIPVPNEAMLLLQAYLGHQELSEIDRTLPDGDQLVFVNFRNRQVPEHLYFGEARRLSARAIDIMIKKYAKAAGIPEHEAHAHALRHLVGSELAEESASTLEIQAILGHADPKTTEIYTHLASRKLTEVIDRANPLGKIKTPVSSLLNEMIQEGVL